MPANRTFVAANFARTLVFARDVQVGGADRSLEQRECTDESLYSLELARLQQKTHPEWRSCGPMVCPTP